MEIKVSDYLSAHRQRALYEINRAEESIQTVTVVLNVDTGELYRVDNANVSEIPPKDCIVHKCTSFLTERDSDYLDKVIKLMSDSGVMLETGVIYLNRKKAKLINAYEEMANVQTKMVKRTLNPIYSSIHFVPDVHQKQIDERFADAVRYIKENSTPEEYAEVEREFSGFLRLAEFVTIGRKVIEPYDDQDYCLCPNCGYELAPAEWEMYGSNIDNNYCQKCGQKIIWKD